jgi:lysine/ornithine N-monooxygenase
MSTLKDVQARNEQRKKRAQAHQEFMDKHPSEPGKCCAMCIVVGCEQTAACICKPVNFMYYVGQSAAEICADCAKKIREKNSSAKVVPISHEMDRVGGKRRKRKSKRKKTRKRKTRRKRKRKRKRTRRR